MNYHKGYTTAQARAAKTQTMRDRRNEAHHDKLLTQEVIVWDGEGMKLSGPTKAQHYVLFGCSARPESPLVINGPRDRLTFEQIADYCMSVVREHPNAIHLGYFFKYDQNMIIWSLPWPAKQVLYSRGSCMVRRGTTKYFVRCVFGKTLRITRVRADGQKLSILIEDFAPFFASSFVKAYEKLFPHPSDPKNWAIVVQGKKDRAVTEYKDLDNVTRYWRAEIVALHELAAEFRRLMFEGGFMLTQWHGPGALANYIRRNNGLIEHEWGGKETNLPAAVHEAVKGAYYGGHFEQYRIGRIEGPIYAYDINSAYPHGFCQVPSLKEGGRWRHVGAIPIAEWNDLRNPLRTSFALFHVEWRGTPGPREAVLARDIQPLPHRSKAGTITYPVMTNGWYWAPEVQIASRIARTRLGASITITDCWVWDPVDSEEWPWERLMTELYARRRRLQKNKSPAQMGFKLGMNSLYGKYAQRAGGKEKAPQSHTLPIAGYITSVCRAKVMHLMMSATPRRQPGDAFDHGIISVETDGVFTTTGPDQLRDPGVFKMSDELGDWGLKQYDEMIILQNGVYFLRKGNKWEKPKTRGIDQQYFLTKDGDTDLERILTHLAKCGPDGKWPKLKYEGGESFIGLGTAIARCTRKTLSGKMSTNPFKASDLHCTWASDSKEIDPGSTKSKRYHFPGRCRACRDGQTPDQTWHDMVIHDKASSENPNSAAYQLPWEKGYVEPQWELQKAAGIGDIGEMMAE